MFTMGVPDDGGGGTSRSLLGKLRKVDERKGLSEGGQGAKWGIMAEVKEENAYG